MTKTALANLERRSKEEIASRDRLSRENVAAKQRAHEKSEGRKNRIASLTSAGIGSLGKIVSSFNDPAWYKNYIKDLQDFVNVPTYDRLGAQKFSRTYTQINGLPHTVPGIMIFHYVPTVGPQQNNLSHYRNAVNQTLGRTKEKILALNSRSSVNWEFSDLGYNIFCSASLIALIEDLKRAILVYQTYRAKNAYLAKTLIEALGWSYSDMVLHYAEYRKLYVLLVQRFNTTIVAPKSMSLYARKIYLNSNVFTDTDENGYIRQMYAFSPKLFFRLTDDATSCEAVSVVRSDYTAFRDQILVAFDRIASNPDFLEMYQDLRHAFGEDIVQLDESATEKEIVFNDVALNREQIHNMMMSPYFRTFGSTGTMRESFFWVNRWAIHQDTQGYLYQGGSSAMDRKFIAELVWDGSDVTATLPVKLLDAYEQYYGQHRTQFFNMHKEKVSGDDILDITRLHFDCDVTWSDNKQNIELCVTGCGTEIVANADIWCFEASSGNIHTYTISSFTMYNCAKVFDAGGAMARLALLSSFDWAPIITAYPANVMYNTNDLYLVDENKSVYCDAHTTFEVDADTVYKIHEAAVMSELYISDGNFKRFN